MNFLKFIFAMFLGFLPGILGTIVAPMQTGGNLWYNTLNHSMLLAIKVSIQTQAQLEKITNSFPHQEKTLLKTISQCK